ncbi:MAG: hypothetical protein ACTSR1_00185 [Candidatus Heimdallarchaeota archaeon]
MKNEELLEYIKDNKEDMQRLFEDLRLSLNNLTNKFEEHASSGSKYRFQVDNNKKHIDKIKHKIDGSIPTVLKFADRVIENENGIVEIKSNIDKIKKKNIILDIFSSHPKLITVVVSMFGCMLILIKEKHLSIF